MMCHVFNSNVDYLINVQNLFFYFILFLFINVQRTELPPIILRTKVYIKITCISTLTTTIRYCQTKSFGLEPIYPKGLFSENKIKRSDASYACLYVSELETPGIQMEKKI